LLETRGGAGTTTLACTLAAELREQTSRDTLLVDLDLNAGMVAYLMGVQPEYSMSDAVGYLERLDLSIWEKLVSKGPGAVDILPPRICSDPRTCPRPRCHHCCSLHAPLYSWIVLDLGRLNSQAVQLLRELDKLLVVTSVGVCSLHQSLRVLATLHEAKTEIPEVHVVVNHLLHPSHFLEEELSTLFGMPISCSLPADVGSLARASSERTLPLPDSHFHQKVATTARHLAGLPSGQSASPLASLKRHLWSVRPSKDEAHQ
jgi:pilus assembly protein CpaE